MNCQTAPQHTRSCYLSTVARTLFCSAVAITLAIFSPSRSEAATPKKPLTLSVRRSTVSVKVESSITPLSSTNYASIISLSGGTAEVSAKNVGGKFSFKAPNGVSAVILRSEALRAKRSYQPVAAVTFVGAKSLAALREEPSRSAYTSGMRVSVGGIALLKSDGTSVGNVPGSRRPMLADTSFIGDLVNYPKKCGKVVLDPEYDTAYGAVAKELKLAASRYIDPRFRRDFKQGISTLTANAPQFRLTGSFSQLGKGRNGDASLQLVDLGSGQVIWRKEYFGLQSLDEITADAAASVWRELCSAQVPHTISGSFQGTNNDFGQNWDGTVTFQIDPHYENLTLAELGRLQSIPYLVTGLSANWGQSYVSGPCTITGAASHAWTSGELGVSAPLQLRLDSDDQFRPAYYLALGLTSPVQTLQSLDCPGSSIPPYYISWGVTVITDPGANFIPFPNSGTSIESSADGSNTYSWNLQVMERFTPREE